MKTLKNTMQRRLQKQFKPETAGYLKAVHTALAHLAAWDDDSIHQAIQQTCESLGIKLGKLGPALRVAVTGSASSPSLELTLGLIGRERSLARIEAAVVYVEKMPTSA